MTTTPPPGTEKRRRKLVDWNLGDGRDASRPGSSGRRPSRPAPDPGRPDDAERSWGPPAGPAGAHQGGGTGTRAEPGTGAGPKSAEIGKSGGPGKPGESGTVSGPDQRAAPAVDPRMRRRRAEVLRASGWRRVRIAGAVLTVVMIVAGLFGLAHTRLVSARHLRVSGASPARVNEVLTAAGLTVGQPMIDVHPGRSQQDLQLVPWVASASVRREWPSTVRIVVVPRRAVAQVPSGSSPSGPVVEVDMTGRIMARSTTPRPDLPVLLGVGTPGAVGQWLPQSRGAGWPIGSAETRPIAASAALSTASDAVSGALALTADLQTDGNIQGIGTHRIRLTRIEVAADSTISAELSPGPVTVFFGAPTMLAAKAAALESMLRAVTLTAGSVLDLQVPYRPTVTGTGAAASS